MAIKFSDLFLNWIFWLVVTFIAVSLFLVGCNDDGRTRPTRMASRIIRGGDGTINTELEGGEPSFSEGYMWLAYEDDFGYIIEQAGVRMEKAVDLDTYWNEGYYYPTANTDIEGCETTGEGGRLMLRGWRKWFPRQYNIHTAQVEYRSPTDGNCKNSAYFGSNGQTDVLNNPKYVAWAADCTTDATLPRWVRPVQVAYNNMTPAEYTYLTQPAPENIPESGLSVLNLDLVQQQGSLGVGYTTVIPESGFMAFNTNDAENMMKYASPMMYSYTVATAEPADLIGNTYNALIKTDQVPDGMNIGISVVASNQENTIHVARTDYFLPVDTRFYDDLIASGPMQVFDRWSLSSDPNTLDTHDPNFVPDESRLIDCAVIPIAVPDDELRIEFLIDGNVLIDAAGSWLDSGKLFDINNDGIVNLKDLYFE